MKRFLALALSTGAVMPLFWASIIPWASQYCPRDAKGNLVAYSVLRENGFGQMVNLVFGEKNKTNRDPQTKLCTMVSDYPM